MGAHAPGRLAGRGQSFEEHKETALALGRRALDLASDDVEVAAHAACAIGFFGEEFNRSLRLPGDAVDRCPNFAWAWASLGMQHAHYHGPHEGVRACNQAIRLSPRDPMAFRHQLAKAAALSHALRWDEVIDAARSSLEINPNLVGSRVYLVCALAAEGNEEALVIARKEMITRFPETTISRFRGYYGHFHNYQRIQEDFEHLMRLAGLPE